MIAILCIINLILSIKTVIDPDYLWHISVGKYILSNGVPDSDIFSWYGKLNNLEFISHEWLSDVIMYLITPLGIVILFSIFILIFYIFLVKFLKISKTFSISNILKIFWLILCMVTLGGMQHRPYLFSYLLFLIFILILFKYLDGNLKDNRNLIVIPILQLIWVNVHGGSSSLILLILSISILVNFIFYKNKKQYKKLIIILILSILISLINPYTYKILLYPFINMGDTVMINTIVEWFSPNFHGLFGIYYFVVIIFPIIVLFLSNRKRINYIDVIIYIMFLFMMFRSVRFIHYYIFFSTYVVGKYMIDFKCINLSLKLNIKAVKIALYGMLSILLLLGTFYQILSFKNCNDKFYYSNTAVTKLKELNPKRLFNDYNTGGFLTYSLYDSNVDIFINGIADIYSKTILSDSCNFVSMSSDPRKIINKYQFDAIILMRNTPLEYYLLNDTEYSLYYEDDTAIIFSSRSLLY